MVERFGRAGRERGRAPSASRGRRGRLPGVPPRARLPGALGRGRGTAYRLSCPLSDLLRGATETDPDTDLDDEAVRLRVQAILVERGRLTNADVRRLSGYSRTETVRLMAELRRDGVARLEGRGRGAI